MATSKSTKTEDSVKKNRRAPVLCGAKYSQAGAYAVSSVYRRSPRIPGYCAGRAEDPAKPAVCFCVKVE